MTSLIEMQRVTATNMAARTYALALGRSGCEDVLLNVFKTLLTSLDKLRSIVEVVEERILVNI